MRYITILVLASLLGVGCTSTKNQADVRETRTFDFNWHFYLGNQESASQPDVDHRSWMKVDLPHDWSIAGEYKEGHSTGGRGGFLPMGIGWYRKSFDWDPSWKDKQVKVHFDGIYMNSEVWINGHYLGKRPNGYVSFQYDLTPWLKKGENVMAVRVDNSKAPSGRWYTGAGIYRHVWLRIHNPTHIPQWGVFVQTPEVSRESATIQVQTDVVHGASASAELTLESHIVDPSGGVRRRIVQSREVDSMKRFTQSVNIDDPQLWSPDNPVVYRLRSYVKQKGEVVDSMSTLFGIRSLDFTAEDGFRLNGEKTIIKGVSNHQDGGGAIGVAMPEDTRYQRLKMLKDMGCNAVRTAHHPFASEFYTMCDTMGLLVLADAMDGWKREKAKYDYGLYFEDWWEKDMTNFVKRTRNHPSIFMYCLGNEVRDRQDRLKTRKSLDSLFKSLDGTRPTTQAGIHNSKYLDVQGFNGNGEEKGALEYFHRNHPDVPVIGTEMTHSSQTRGVYRTQTWYRTRDVPAPWEIGKSWKKFEPKVHKVPDLTDEEVFDGFPRQYASSYDNHLIRISVRDEWKRVKKYDYLVGDFRWTGFDYLGESLRGWPARANNSGIIDLAMIPKDHYYLYQSLWDDTPMVHLLPHWTHPGKKGETIPVVAYTNADRAELFLNGESLGEKPMTNDLQIVWKVPYRPGTLEVKAYRQGETVATDKQQTAGPGRQLRLESDRSIMKANRRDVAHLKVSVLDSNGTLVPEADQAIHFDIQGPARLLGVENGDILDLSPHDVPRRKAFKGKCLLVIQNTGERGVVRVTASAEDLRKAETIIEVQNEK